MQLVKHITRYRASEDPQKIIANDVSLQLAVSRVRYSGPKPIPAKVESVWIGKSAAYDKQNNTHVDLPSLLLRIKSDYMLHYLKRDICGEYG